MATWAKAFATAARDHQYHSSNRALHHKVALWPKQRLPLEGRVAVVTGSSSGIGAETARALARLGARVALGARRKDKLEAVRAEIVAECGRDRAIAVPTDVTKREEVCVGVTPSPSRLHCLSHGMAV